MKKIMMLAILAAMACGCGALKSIKATGEQSAAGDKSACVEVVLNDGSSACVAK